MSTGDKIWLGVIYLLAAAFFYHTWKQNRQRTADREIAQFLADIGEEEFESVAFSLV